MTNEENTIQYRPIGYIHSPFKELSGMPIQPARANGVRGSIEILPEFQEGLADLDGFSHIVLLYHLHKSRGYRLKIVPFLDTELRGLFATRAPKRPNPIGLSVVRLLGIEKGTLHIADLDIVDGTPLLDIKPYVPTFDQPDQFRTGWLEKLADKGQDVKSDERFQ